MVCHCQVEWSWPRREGLRGLDVDLECPFPFRRSGSTSVPHPRPGRCLSTFVNPRRGVCRGPTLPCTCMEPDHAAVRDSRRQHALAKHECTLHAPVCKDPPPPCTPRCSLTHQVRKYRAASTRWRQRVGPDLPKAGSTTRCAPSRSLRGTRLLRP